MEYDNANATLAITALGSQKDDYLFRWSSDFVVNYYHQGNLGSVDALTDTSGVLTEKYRYDAFGKTAILDGYGFGRSTSLYGNRFLYVGREYFSQLGIYDFRNRIYDPGIGRFLQTDTLRFTGADFNLYTYSGNQPLTFNDPDGEIFPLLIVIAVVAADAYYSYQAGTALYNTMDKIANGYADADRAAQAKQDMVTDTNTDSINKYQDSLKNAVDSTKEAVEAGLETPGTFLKPPDAIATPEDAIGTIINEALEHVNDMDGGGGGGGGGGDGKGGGGGPGLRRHDPPTPPKDPENPPKPPLPPLPNADDNFADDGYPDFKCA